MPNKGHRPSIDLHVEATTRLIEALAASENRMTRRISLLSEVIFEVSHEGVLVYLNAAWEVLTGLKRSDCLGTNLDAFILSGEGFSIPFAGLVASVQTGTNLFQLKTDAPAPTWIKLVISELANDGYVGVISDITSETLAQEEIAKLSAVASYTDNLVIICDRAGLCEWVNNAFTLKTGYELHEIIGRKPGEILIGPDTDLATSRRLGRAIKESRSINEEILNYTKTGEPYWVTIQLTPIFDDNGRVRRFISVQSDSTRRKDFELQILRQNEALAHSREELARALEREKEANEAKSVFLANMSHEIRTPLNGVLAVAAMLLTSSLDDEQKDLVSLIVDSGRGLEAILTDILDYSKIEAGKVELERIPFTPAASLRPVADMMAIRAKEKGLDLKFSSEGPVSDYYWGDAQRIRQVFLNLLSNAIKFTDEGQIGARLVLTKDEAALGIDWLLIEVSDTGIGFTSDLKDRIFDRFEQADRSLARRYGGTGLGLAISAGLVNLMGGMIDAQSIPNVGSTFSVRLPLERFEDEAAPSVAGGLLSENRYKGLSVLLAEDHKTNQKIISLILSPLGASLHIASDGLEAVEAYANSDFDLILMDLQMPKVDGLEATRRIRDMEITSGRKRTPIVVLSANCSSEKTLAITSAGADAHVLKPFTAKELIHTLGKVLTDLAVPDET